MGKAAIVDAGRRIARSARRRLKSFAYSGFRRDRWQQPDRVLAELSLVEGMRVAEIGAGAGFFTFRVAHAVGTEGVVYAVDTDADMTSLLEEEASRRGLGNVAVVQADATDPRIPEKVDLVLLVDAFHHLPEPATYAQALARYLRRGGRVAIIEPRPRWYLFGHATQPDRIRSDLAQAGYSLAAAYDFLERQSFLVFERPVPT
jgi:arsenite methyltransferase